ncbi:MULTISPECIES: diaminopropionate ammonia-lyase [unclassified Arcobacter]|uniref:diaminopropionate ammonia-lyase n=1 Tax=unclassified Arcobacter TaxID=2593671 RepID=UPI00100A59FF|nr:diaminopropionate ammonia-lyase [Arcobacter sp. CECT 8989]RXJ98498.1 diaminopropionate ammonia-lyase [Arcobacter sp. CECT 8989]
MINNFKKYLEQTELFDNTKNLRVEEYKHQDILSLEGFEKASKEITSWDGFEQTPLVSLDDLAKQTGVSKLYYKNEHYRFSLKSFKALGGAYAVANLLINKLKEQGIEANSKDLLSGKYKDITSKITVSCATDGNHGKSVAWGASIFGCNCEIFIHSHVSVTREKEIAKYGAIMHRIEGNYDDSVHEASRVANEKGFFTVSDTSYEGYTEVPKDVMQGYTIMVDEALRQMGEKPTHVFLQGGVGGMAAAVVSFIHETYGENSPIFVMIEPTNADCLLQSARNGEPTVVHGDLDTVMAGLSCGEVSLLAWKILEHTTKAFFSIPDEPIAETMKYLASLPNPVVAGESAVAGLAGFMITQFDEEYRKILQLDENSKVLFLGTEGDTDEQIYTELVGKSSQEVLSKA